MQKILVWRGMTKRKSFCECGSREWEQEEEKFYWKLFLCFTMLSNELTISPFRPFRSMCEAFYWQRDLQTAPANAPGTRTNTSRRIFNNVRIPFHQTCSAHHCVNQFYVWEILNLSHFVYQREMCRKGTASSDRIGGTETRWFTFEGMKIWKAIK